MGIARVIGECYCAATRHLSHENLHAHLRSRGIGHHPTVGRNGGIHLESRIKCDLRGANHHRECGLRRAASKKDDNHCDECNDHGGNEDCFRARTTRRRDDGD